LYFVPCSRCGGFWAWDWDLVEWEKDERGDTVPGSVRIRCSLCDHYNEEHNKTAQLEAGKWIAQNPAGKYPSFRINALYKPAGWGSWFDLVEGYRTAKKDGIQAYKVWHNTKRVLPWEEEGTRADSSALFSRRENYGAEVPDGVLVITAAVDVQDDRLEAEAVGWGRGLENWGIERVTIRGDTSGRMVWDDLDRWLAGGWYRSNGDRQYIAAAGIDALGHRTEEVYNFCKPREARRIYPFYGRGGDGLPILGRVVRRHRTGVWLFPIGSDTCKDEILAGLLVEEVGPRYSHFPAVAEYDEEFFKQLAAESKVLVYKDNRPAFKWRKLRERNEALDIRQINRAVLDLILASVNLDEMTDPYMASPADYNAPAKLRRVSKGVQL
jgi:phage terminase large subunit GpA-like protein